MERRKFVGLGLVGVGGIALADNAWALKYYPKESDKKWAVVYSTWCGTSRDASLWISEGMCGIADVFDVREEPELKGFDHIIIGGSIRGMRVSKELQEYINKNKDWMKAKIRGLFAVCGNGRTIGPAEKASFIDNHLAKLCEVSNVPSKVFTGRITRCLLAPGDLKGLEQYFQKMKMGPVEDYDYLKRADCMAFGKEILAAAG